MKNKFKQISIITLFVLQFSTVSISQNTYLYKGELGLLRDQTQLNVQYDYSNMSLGRYENEKDYLNERIAKRNSKNPGSGDECAKRWVADRNARFEPQFEELFNKHLAKKGFRVGSFPDAKYTMILHTYFTEPGFSAGVWSGDAKISTDIWFIESSNKDKVIAKMTIKNIPGQNPGQDWIGLDYGVEYHIQEAYGLCGKTLAKYLKKNVF